MSAIPFSGGNILDQMDDLRAAGFTEAQAKAQLKAMQVVARACDEDSRRPLATNDSLIAVRNELRDEIRDTRLSTIKWVVGSSITLGAFLAAVIFGLLAFLPRAAAIIQGG